MGTGNHGSIGVHCRRRVEGDGSVPGTVDCTLPLNSVAIFDLFFLGLFKLVKKEFKGRYHMPDEADREDDVEVVEELLKFLQHGRLPQ
ncbi:hypothetical protein V1527DRAFT_493559 [Lipomyces starkeyi]